MYVSNTLISWYLLHKRDLPWRNTKNPYIIWLSEVILQQTRVEQGLPYFNHFVDKYPTVTDLANASEDEVLRSWQGLGYYSRARNLHSAAKQVVKEFNAEFPSTYHDLLKLKGVGDYTAAAIASFAFKEACPVLDGNVFRFISRYFGIHTPINASSAKKEFISVLNDIIDSKQSDLFNQSIMEFGALQCKPKNPDCSVCPFMSSCFAYNNDEVNILPIKEKKLKRSVRHFYYFVHRTDNTYVLNKRIDKDIWQHLYEFPLLESKEELEEKNVLQQAIHQNLISNEFELIGISKKIKHVLSHQDIYAKFFEIRDPHFKHQNRGKYLYIKDDEIRDFALPRLIEQYLQK